MKTLVFGALFLAAAIPAHADGSYVLPDGTNRAPAVTLHCVAPGGGAVPCGTSGTPMVVTVPTGATAGNQASQITAEQSSAAALGSVTDTPYSGGSGSLAAILKGLWGALTSGVAAVPVGGAPISRSAMLIANTSTAVFPVNAQRRYIAFQAPQGTYVWVNFLGGQASPNGTDCSYFPAGALYESGQWVNRGVISVYAPVAVSFSAWEN